MKKLIRNILTGKDYIPSQRDFKYATLRGQFTLIVIFVGIFYISLDLSNGVTKFIPWYAGMVLIAIGILVLNRHKHYGAATTMLLTLINLIIYLFTDVDIPQGGVFFYFMTCSIVGLILGVYYSTRMGFFFALLPIALGILAYLTDSNLMPPPSYDPVMIKINFIANIVIGILSNIFIVYFLISRNKESESSLRENEQLSKKIADDLSLKNDQLAKTNEELDRFVYSASHDMRAPLSSLMGLINISEKTSDLNEIKTYMNLMKGRIHTMDGFIREITDYSRNSRLGLSMQNVNLKDVINSVSENLSYIDGDKRVRVEILPGCNRVIYTDINRLTVVINNLLSNAYRYHRYNQPDPYIEFNTTDVLDNVYITVRDNGQGIPAEHVNKIFDMFYRASDMSEGSGLGLYIVKETLEKLGGTISVQSVLGEGSLFTITLPR